MVVNFQDMEFYLMKLINHQPSSTQDRKHRNRDMSNVHSTSVFIVAQWICWMLMACVKNLCGIGTNMLLCVLYFFPPKKLLLNPSHVQGNCHFLCSLVMFHSPKLPSRSTMDSVIMVEVKETIFGRTRPNDSSGVLSFICIWYIYIENYDELRTYIYI